MSDVRYTDVEMANPSTAQQRQMAAQRQADTEVGDADEAVNVRLGDVGTRVGDDSRLWWSVSFEVISKHCGSE